ncbi:MAG: hypothetical protein WD648_10165 [Planctomycetaceae bacterium]
MLNAESGIQDLGSSPHPPSNSNGSTRFDPESVDIPPPIDTPAMRASWKEWCEYRRSKRKPVSEKSVPKQIAWLLERGETRAIEAIETAIRNDWQGLFPPHQKAKSGGRLDGIKRWGQSRSSDNETD